MWFCAAIIFFASCLVRNKGLRASARQAFNQKFELPLHILFSNGMCTACSVTFRLEVWTVLPRTPYSVLEVTMCIGSSEVNAISYQARQVMQDWLYRCKAPNSRSPPDIYAFSLSAMFFPFVVKRATGRQVREWLESYGVLRCSCLRHFL